MAEEEVETKVEEKVETEIKVETKIEAPDLPKTLEEAHAKLAELQAQLAKPPEGLLKRVDNLTARLREAERGGEASKALVTQLTNQIEELKRTGKVVVGPTTEQVQAEARRLSAENDYNSTAAKVMSEGQTAYSDFAQAVQQLHNVSPFFMRDAQGQSFPNMPREFLEAVFETDTPARVLHELALPAHSAEAARIMSLPPSKQGVALAKFAVALKPEKKISQAEPPPRTTVGGTTRHTTTDLSDEKLPIADFMKLRNEASTRKRA